MRIIGRSRGSLVVSLILILMSACQASHTSRPLENIDTTTISGRVVNEDSEPLAGAVVRLKATDWETSSDTNGFFSLTVPISSEPEFVTAWLTGYYINGVDDVLPGSVDVEIVLHSHHDTDNPDYAWLPSQYHEGEGEDQGCAECHSNQNTDFDFTLPVDEWLLDAHSQSATNRRFLTMYTGSDVEGNQSPSTRYTSNRDYGRFPLRPDPEQSYYGPGYRLDFPNTAGNCAACHTPLPAVDDPYAVDPTRLSGVELEGISCDFCHKVWDVRFDPVTSMPYPNMPGVLSFEFRRPPEGHQFFAGSLDDVAPGEDTYHPIQRESQFCAPCHFGVFWDTTIYNSFGEWLESPYSDSESGQTCQDCHMPPLDVTHFARIDQGGVARNPQTIFSHRMPGAADVELLQNALTLAADGRRENDRIIVRVTITNGRTGHHVPTDSPLRHLILLVKACDTDGTVLEQLDGPIVPEWGGVGNPDEGYYAGSPGKVYAKILMELWTEVSPSGAYWNPTRIVSDNRIPAFGEDSSEFTFAAPEIGDVEVTVKLLFRRAFITLMDQKGWDVPDILMEEITLPVP